MPEASDLDDPRLMNYAIPPEPEADIRRRERISMAREICLHKGENPNFIDRYGHDNWEKYEPLAGAVIREAERLFALRKVIPVDGQAPLRPPTRPEELDGKPYDNDR